MKRLGGARKRIVRFVARRAREVAFWIWSEGHVADG